MAAFWKNCARKSREEIKYAVIIIIPGFFVFGNRRISLIMLVLFLTQSPAVAESRCYTLSRGRMGIIPSV